MSKRRLSLRGRLIAIMLAVAAVALIAVDVVIPLSTRATMMSAKSQTLTSVMANLKTMGSGPLSEQLATLSSETALGGQIGWTLGFRNGTSKVWQPVSSYPDANPAVGWQTSTERPEVVSDIEHVHRDYLAMGLRAEVTMPDRASDAAVNIVAWVPLADVDSTIGRLALLEIVISLGLLVVLGAIASIIIRRELRPLETMARAADRIAGGDLTLRVEPGVAGTEVGQLGTAFNGMVDGVSNLLAERAESERRMGQFVADASHELRTPVAAIRGYTDLYRAGALPHTDAVSRAMSRMGFESKRMGALVEDLLTLTQTDSDQWAPADAVDLGDVLAGVVDDAAVIDSTRTWRLAGTATSAIVTGDRNRLHQLFANLLANIRTHTPEGTTATVSMTTIPYAVAVSVIDDGPGVADDDLGRLFDRFFRVDKARSRQRGGSGLGLSIAAAIVRAHRGRIMTDHTPGGGLTVTVVLPLAATGDHEATPPTTTESAGDADSSTAGVVSDDAPERPGSLDDVQPGDESSDGGG